MFSWQQPLIELNGTSMRLFNIRSWNGHLEHFLSDKIYSTYTNIINSPAIYIDEVLIDCKDIHRNIHHGLALCYRVNKVNITEVI